MKRSWPILFMFVLLLSLLASSSAWAHRPFGPWPGHGNHWNPHSNPHWNHWHGHRHAHVGVVIGIPLGGPWHYGYPPVVAVPATPPVYIEQSVPLQGQQQSNSWWYYCRAPQGYYPYVRQCPPGWQLVPAQPLDLQ